MTRRFWTAVCNGGCRTHGETFYSDDEVLWWAKGGVLKGESPARIAFLREIVESLPGPAAFWGEGIGAMTAGRLAYMKEQCAARTELNLPQEGRYRIEVIREKGVSMLEKKSESEMNTIIAEIVEEMKELLFTV